MDIVRAIILGLIQAVTEFLPISSSAHLILFRDWLGLVSVDGLTFDVALHVGTLAALLLYFRRDLGRLAAAWVRSLRRPALAEEPAQRLAWLLLAGTVPAVVLGVVFNNLIENVLRTPAVIVVTLTLGAALFLVVERRLRPTGTIDQVTLKAALIVGVAQSLALIPGVSRSGITTVAGMTQNLSRAEAARFSFLLGVPIMIGASLKKALELGDLTLHSQAAAVMLAGVLSAAVGGWLVIGLLLRFFQTHRLDAFAFYRIALAIAVLLLRL